MPRLPEDWEHRLSSAKDRLLHHFKNVTVVLLVSLYLGLFSLVISSGDTPRLPTTAKEDVLDLGRAWRHLQSITKRPHPYNSHANDHVREYIGSYIYNLTLGLDFVEIDNDEDTVAHWVKNNKFNYFEGNNVVVKIKGTRDLDDEDDRGGVLFSAHFDSVATAPGVTDDGIAVATLLEFIRYLTKNRPPNTAVFNINNGEEDGLHGAYAFLNHKWAKIPATFLNIEGAGAGGIPQLFRSTRYAPVHAFRHATHPSGSSVSRDAFASGLIRSDTDFSVYQAVMEGLDVAFYKPRSRYHTKHDSIPGADSSSDLPENAKRSLWTLMELVREVGVELLEEGLEYTERTVDPVFFDLLGKQFFVFNSDFLLALDGILLLFGPLVLYLLRTPSQTPARGWRDRWASVADMHWLRLDEIRAKVGHCIVHPNVCSGAAFWLSLVGTAFLQFLFVALILHYNPFVIHNHALLVVAAAIGISYLGLVVYHPRTPASKNSHTTRISALRHIYALSWVMTLGATVALWKYTLCGTFVVTIYHLQVTLAACVACVEARRLRKEREVEERYRPNLHTDVETGPIIGDEDRTALPSERTPLLGTNGNGAPSAYGSHPTRANAAPTEANGHHPRQPQPSTPEPLAVPTPVIAASQCLLFLSLPFTLYQTLVNGVHPKFVYLVTGLIFCTVLADADAYISLWVVQLLLIVPIPVAIITQTLVQFIAALNQTLVDGSNPSIVYGGIAVLSTLIVLPLVPFALPLYEANSARPLDESVAPDEQSEDAVSKPHYPTSALWPPLALIVLSCYLLLAFPFSQSDPLVVSFFQDVQIDLGLRHTGPAYEPIAHVQRARTTLIGASGYLHGPHRSIVDNFPSANPDKAKDSETKLRCQTAGVKTIQSCEWNTTNLESFNPVPGRRVNQGLHAFEPNNTQLPAERNDSPWFDVQIQPGSRPRTAVFTIHPTNTRRCQIDFESHPILWYRVVDARQDGFHNSTSGPEDAFVEEAPVSGLTAESVKSVDIWRRERDTPFSVVVGWGSASDAALGSTPSGRVGCWWAEYESAMVGLPEEDGRWLERPRIPAYEEVLDYLPLWAVSRGRHKDLVQVWGDFTL